MFKYRFLLIVLFGFLANQIMGQKLSKTDLEGTWKFKSWKTFYTQFHPDMAPEEDSDSWMEINEEKPTSEIMEVVFGKRSNFYNSSIRLIDKIKIGTWNEAEFKINGKSKEGWWEYDEEENVIMFLVQGLRWY